MFRPLAVAVVVSGLLGWSTPASAQQTSFNATAEASLQLEAAPPTNPINLVSQTETDEGSESDSESTSTSVEDQSTTPDPDGDQESDSGSIIDLPSESSTSEEENEPTNSVALVKSVYAGHDGGAGCSTAKTFAEAKQHDPVTYCFEVTNTGTAHLGEIMITDPFISNPITLVGAESVPLAPGHSAHFYAHATPPADQADGIADDTFTNVASVKATPLDGASNPVDGEPDVMASAEAIVFPPEVVPEPGLTLTTSVYAWHDGGLGCPAADLTLVDEGDPITYCYVVTNTGNTHLASISLEQFDIESTPALLRADSKPLAPGDSAYYFMQVSAPLVPAEGITTSASAVANSVDPSGADLTGVGDVSAEDGAQIQLPSTVIPVAAADPAAAAAADADPAAADPSAQATTPDLEQTSAPDQLAYTGWASWIIVIAGIGLAAAGWSMVQQAPTRRRMMPAVQPERNFE